MGPEVGIYVGSGTSHSWTWFADIFERSGLYTLTFVTEEDVATGILKNLEVLLISGGDTFAIANGLGPDGAVSLKAFITNGGLYIGSCAGAYLPLKSSLAPLNLFNFVAAKITNLTRNLPEPKKMPEKYCTEYGCCYVFHPVREEVKIKIAAELACKTREVTAPLYGGPALMASEDIEVLATYTGFTPKTEFLVDEDIARQTLLGRVAVAGKRLGNGRMYLFGPHFEHPQYTEANSIFFRAVLAGCKNRQNHNHLASVDACNNSAAIRKLVRLLKGEISNARIIALAFERLPYQWRLGRKVYEPEKIRVFLEAVWSRIVLLEDPAAGGICEQEISDIVVIAQRVTATLKDLKKQAACDCNTTQAAEKLFLDLKKLCAQFLTIYFRLKQRKSDILKPQKNFHH